jgi:hypothetical protein
MPLTVGLEVSRQRFSYEEVGGFGERDWVYGGVVVFAPREDCLGARKVP